MTPAKPDEPALVPPAPSESYSSPSHSTFDLRSPALRVGGILALGFLPLLAQFFINLWSRPAYQFFPLALAGAIVLAWQRLRSLRHGLVPGSNVIATTLLSLAFVLLFVATIIRSPWLGAVAALVATSTVAWMFGGAQLLQAMIPAGLMVVMLLPPPLNLDQELTLKLQTMTTKWSSKVLDQLSVTHILRVNVIEIPNRRLLVEEACSGINSILFVSSAALFYSFWRRRSLTQILLSTSISVAFVLVGNTARITSGVWLQDRHQIDVLSGSRHTLVGLALLASYLGLILNLDQLLLMTLKKHSHLDAERDETSLPILNPPQLSSRWAWPVAAVFAVMGVVQVVFGLIDSQRTTAGRRETADAALRAGASFAMPEQIGEWHLIPSRTTVVQKIEAWGLSSQIWNYQAGDFTASVALDYPFRGYHDVTVCYTLQGWHILDRNRQFTRDNSEKVPWVEIRMQKDDFRYGALWFATVGASGRWQEDYDAGRSFGHRFGAGLPTTYRVQVLITSAAPLHPLQNESARKFFEAARQKLITQLRTQLAKP